jgi:hypothetical protein
VVFLFCCVRHDWFAASMECHQRRGSLGPLEYVLPIEKNMLGMMQAYRTVENRSVLDQCQKGFIKMNRQGTFWGQWNSTWYLECT